jgi:hypothetical protein
MRAVNHYRLDGNDPSIVASGLTVFDLGLAKRVLARYVSGTRIVPRWPLWKDSTVGGRLAYFHQVLHQVVRHPCYGRSMQVWLYAEESKKCLASLLQSTSWR